MEECQRLLQKVTEGCRSSVNIKGSHRRLEKDTECCKILQKVKYHFKRSKITEDHSRFQAKECCRRLKKINKKKPQKVAEDQRPLQKITSHRCLQKVAEGHRGSVKAAEI